MNGHLSSLYVATQFKRPTRRHGGQPYRLLFGLAPDGVSQSLFCHQKSGELLPRLSTLTGFPAVYFCCTFLRVAPTGRYPASCPMELGLSSRSAFRHLNARPSDLLTACYIVSHFRLSVKTIVAYSCKNIISNASLHG